MGEHEHKNKESHSTKKPVTTKLTYPWKCTVLHCNHLGNTWKPLVLMTRHFNYCPSASEGDNQSVRSSAPVVSRCFPGGYNVKLYISRGRLAWWLLAFLHSERVCHLVVSASGLRLTLWDCCFFQCNFCLSVTCWMKTYCQIQLSTCVISYLEHHFFCLANVVLEMFMANKANEWTGANRLVLLPFPVHFVLPL